MRKLAAIAGNLALGCALLVLAAGATGFGVIVAHCIIFGMPR